MSAGRWTHNMCIKVFPQALAPSKDFAVADARKSAPVGDVLLLRRQAQRWNSHKKRPT